MSRLSAKFGNLRVLMSVVVLWILICVATYIIGGLAEKGANAEYGFYAVATAIGLVMGGIQSLSRSTYSKLMPETKDTASFFSFYDLTEKVAIVIGMFSIGFIDEMLGMLNGVLSLIIFFCIGLIGLIIASKKQRSLMKTQFAL
jgi:UMF1 family MFS transporter